MEFQGIKSKWSIANDNIVTSEEQDICMVNIFLEAYMEIQNAEQEKICKANTLLISKAPEMLDALKKVLLDIKLTNAFNLDSPIVRNLEDVIKSATEI